MELRLQPLLQRATSIPSSDVSPRGALCNRLKINLFNVVSGVSPHWQLDLSPEPPPQPKIMDGWIIGWMTLSWVLRTCRCSTYLQAGNTAVPQQNSWRQCCAVKIGNDLRLTNKWKMLSKRQQAHQWCDLKKFQGKKKNSGSYLVVPVTPIPPEKPFGHVLFPIPCGTQGGEWKTKCVEFQMYCSMSFFSRRVNPTWLNHYSSEETLQQKPSALAHRSQQRLHYYITKISLYWVETQSNSWGRGAHI